MSFSQILEHLLTALLFFFAFICMQNDGIVSNTNDIKRFPQSEDFLLITNASARENVKKTDDTFLKQGIYAFQMVSLNPKTGHFKVSSPVEDAQLCFIPFYLEDGEKIPAGKGPCLWARHTDETYTIHFNVPEKTSIDGVIIVKNTAYFYETPYNRYALPEDLLSLCLKKLEKQERLFCRGLMENEENTVVVL